jgi:hypothetical protein
MGSLIGDIFSGVKTAVVTAVNTTVTQARKQLVTTAQQEAAAQASKIAQDLLHKKKQSGVIPKPAKPSLRPAVTAEPSEGGEVAPAQPERKGDTAAFAGGTAESPLVKYAPYAAALGGLLIVTVIARRK